MADKLKSGNLYSLDPEHEQVRGQFLDCLDLVFICTRPIHASYNDQFSKKGLAMIQIGSGELWENCVHEIDHMYKLHTAVGERYNEA